MIKCIFPADSIVKGMKPEFLEACKRFIVEADRDREGKKNDTERAS